MRVKCKRLFAQNISSQDIFCNIYGTHFLQFYMIDQKIKKKMEMILYFQNFHFHILLQPLLVGRFWIVHEQRTKQNLGIRYAGQTFYWRVAHLLRHTGSNMPSVSLPLQPLMVEQTNIANQSNVMGYTMPARFHQ